MKVIVSAAAEADLEEIGEYIARHSPKAAERIVDELSDRCRQLADMPEAFQQVSRYEHRGVRRRPHKNYLIFYQVSYNAIEIVLILHGARDYMPLLFPED